MDNFSIGNSSHMYMAYGLNQALTAGNLMPLADSGGGGQADLYMGTVEGGEPGAPSFESEGGDAGTPTDGGAMAMAVALSLGSPAVTAGVLAGGDGDASGGGEAE